jgi:hypothetical protein
MVMDALRRPIASSPRGLFQFFQTKGGTRMAPLAVDTPSAIDQQLRLPALLLTFQALLWLAVVAFVIGTGSIPTDPSQVWTDAARSAIAGTWIIWHLLMVLPCLCGIVAMAMIGRTLIMSEARSMAWATLASSAIAVVCALVWMNLGIAMLHIGASTLSELWVDQARTIIIVFWDALILCATMTTGLALRQTNLARRTGLVVAVLSVLVLPLGLFRPPFLYGMLWLALGIALLRRGQVNRAADIRPVVS